MEKLLSFLIESITGSKNFSVSEIVEGNKVTLNVEADSEIVGLIIGREGKTIKNLRKILSIRAARNDLAVNINVNQS